MLTFDLGSQFALQEQNTEAKDLSRHLQEVLRQLELQQAQIEAYKTVLAGG
jgi:hypothetical protein